MPQTETVTIRLPVGVKEKLASLAISTNRTKSWLAAQAIAAYVEEHRELIIPKVGKSKYIVIYRVAADHVQILRAGTRNMDAIVEEGFGDGD